jgi:cyclic beta-1,2-glucan synthetase
VLSGVAASGRARQAMDAMYARLVDPASKVVRLLDPPFDQNGPSPGYIAGYLPGVRENGGQYNHAAIWAAMAFATLGDSARAWSLFGMINPLSRSVTALDVARYKVEPYVMAADVYTVAPHTGRGGWSWYTGSSAWMYRLIVESLLGVRLSTSAGEARLALTPCLPEDWPACSLQYRYGRTTYQIEFVRVRPALSRIEARLDGVLQPEPSVPLRDDGQPHRVEIIC